MVVAVVVATLEAAQPWRPLLAALGDKASIERQVDSVGDRGAFTQRLRFWDQTLTMALANPLGAGNGSYEAIIHAYQKYPMAWSRSPHNYYLETLATGGFPRLVLLIGLLAVPLWRAWRSREWPWALATAGVWSTLAFDVTSYYPAFMMYAFLLVGATHHRSNGATRAVSEMQPSRTLFPVVSLVTAVAMSVWWFLPCEGDRCLIDRYHGVEYLASDYLANLEPDQRVRVIHELRELNPQSLWVLRLELQGASSPTERLRLTREIATRFPNQSPFNFLAWAEAALAVADTSEAAEAVRAGRMVFGQDGYPYGERRMNRELYQQWLDASEEILSLAED